MSRLFFRLSLFAFTSWMMAAPTLAIVIRHDVPDAAYLALESDWPAQFPLFRTREGHPDCIATLIAPRWAVTARHCTQTKVLTSALKSREGGHKVLVAAGIRSSTGWSCRREVRPLADSISHFSDSRIPSLT